MRLEAVAADIGDVVLREPVGGYGGSLKSLTTTELGDVALRDRTGRAPEQIGDAIAGDLRREYGITRAEQDPPARLSPRRRHRPAPT